jgi:Lar family restriction alleviation protein
MSDGLRACPFCGGKAVVRWRYTTMSGHSASFWVLCASCGGSTAGFDSEEEAVSRWNARREPGQMTIFEGGDGE